MGIDIFGSFQAKVGGGWVFQKEYDDGKRGLLRWWLGWGRGGLYAQFGGEALVDDLRGLPPDLVERGARAAPNHSWVLADEVFAALPLLGRHLYFVPRELAREAWEQDATPAQWKALTGITDELDFLKQYGGPPRLISVTLDCKALSNQTDRVEVKCTFDFSEEIEDFIAILKNLRELHEEVRFVYHFE